jgi:hypothetical protein
MALIPYLALLHQQVEGVAVLARRVLLLVLMVALEVVEMGKRH